MRKSSNLWHQITSGLKLTRQSKRNELGQPVNAGISLGGRLFLFLTALILTIIAGVVAILLATGTLTAGMSESKRALENELLHASGEISRDFGQLSLQALNFSRDLAASIEENARKKGLTITGLQEHPDLLEEIITAEYQHALLALKLARCSGVFFILDATVNPTLDRADKSRAGLYIKNMEPHIISSSTPNLLLLRGFPAISRRNGLPLHPQWAMEFDITEAPYYHRPLKAVAQKPGLPLSTYYYWCGALTLPGSSEEIMLCSVPLIDSAGNAFGVCGFDVNAMLFKLSYMPDNRVFNRIFCLLAPLREDTIDLRQSLFAGGYAAWVTAGNREGLKIINHGRFLNSYQLDRDTSFLGLHTPVQFYPEDSVFSTEHWTVAMMLPQEDIVSSITRLNLLLFSLLTLLVITGIACSCVFGKKLFLKPITRGLNLIKSDSLATTAKTNIPELDDLIKYLSRRNQELYQKAKQGNLSFSLLDQFTENMKTLSAAERAVFDLYLEGYTAKEIAGKLYLSINTIKTHTKRIYVKLNIASREELLLYARMLREVGRII